jgi:hypothetical protein
MSTFDTRMANQRTTNFPPAAPHEMKVKTASVWRKHKAVSAICATALATIGLLTIPAPAPAHADCDRSFSGNSDPVLFTQGPADPYVPGEYVVVDVWPNANIMVDFPQPPNSKSAKGGKAVLVFSPLNLTRVGDLDYAQVFKDNMGVTKIEFEINWNPNPLLDPRVPKDGHFEGTVDSNGYASGSIPYPWQSLTRLGCYAPPEQTPPPPPCDDGKQPPPPGAGLLDWVNYARAHPEKYRPNGDPDPHPAGYFPGPPPSPENPGATMRTSKNDCCHKDLTFSDTLANTAKDHNDFLEAQPDQQTALANAHMNDDGKGGLVGSTELPNPPQHPAGGPIYAVGYHRRLAENVYFGVPDPDPHPDPSMPSPETPEAAVVRSWMRDDGPTSTPDHRLAWGHRNNILDCDRVDDNGQPVVGLHEAGTHHYGSTAVPPDPPRGPYGDYWTIDFGTH